MKKSGVAKYKLLQPIFASQGVTGCSRFFRGFCQKGFLIYLICNFYLDIPFYRDIRLPLTEKVSPLSTNKQDSVTSYALYEWPMIIKDHWTIVLSFATGWIDHYRIKNEVTSYADWYTPCQPYYKLTMILNDSSGFTFIGDSKA